MPIQLSLEALSAAVSMAAMHIQPHNTDGLQPARWLEQWTRPQMSMTNTPPLSQQNITEVCLNSLRHRL
jgi:hypothetical protein